ncbi:MAG: molybdenum cofactor biosynthesis protein MoaE [Pseudarcicella sp.]|nr:molybdenum cofactor biosynthesis protein MoaE [Pseudarcicella sp.]
MIQISEIPIDINECIKAAQSEQAGAVDVFIGTVRLQNKGKEVIKLEFETFDSMAIAKMNELAQKAQQQWATEKIVMVHRKGVLEIGDTAVVIAVATKHRKASFEACEWLINNLKKEVPIWKKEIYTDGEEWLEAHA